MNENVPVFHSEKMYPASILFLDRLTSSIWNDLQKFFNWNFFILRVFFLYYLQSRRTWAFRHSTVLGKSLARKTPFCSRRCHWLNANKYWPSLWSTTCCPLQSKGNKFQYFSPYTRESCNLHFPWLLLLLFYLEYFFMHLTLYSLQIYFLC